MSMEVGGKNRKSKRLSESQYNASAESFDLTCSVCAELGKNVGANGYCTECSEYLCNGCIIHHRALKATRRHKIQDEQHMPKDARQAPLPTPPPDECTERCPKHPSKTIEYFCSIHDELACPVDVTLDHVTCGVGYIPELAKGVSRSKEMKRFRTTIDKLKQQSEEIEDKSKEAIDTIEQKSKEYTDAVVQAGDELIEHIRSLVQKAIEEKEEYVEELMGRVVRPAKLSRQTGNEIKTLEENINRDNTSESQLFFHMKSSKRHLVDWEAKLTALKLDAKPVEFLFNKSNTIKKFKEIDSLGEMEKRVRFTEQYKDTDISLPEDKKEPNISDLHVLPDGRIALTDHLNESVKLVTGDGTQIQQVKLPGKPWGITQTDTGKLVVTLPCAQQLHFLKVENGLHPDIVIEINFAPFGIEAYQDKLFVSSNNEIMLVGKDGKEIRTIHTGDRRNTFYDHLTFNPSRSMLHACDLESREVKCLTMEGRVQGTYEMTCKLGRTTVLDDGSVLVSGENGIHHITATGSKIQMITDRVEMGKDFQIMSYFKGTGKLYLAKRFLREIHVE